MKKILLTINIMIAANYLFAQSITPNAVIIKNVAKPKSQGSSMSVMAIDTLDQYFQRATSFFLYGSLDGGYVYGPGFFDNAGSLVPISDETGCHYDGVGNATVTELLLWGGAKRLAGTADSVTAKVYSINPDTSANATLGTATFSLNDLDTSGLLTSVLINAAITSDFLVAIAYAGTDDTFGLVSSDPSMGDGANEKRARQLVTPTFGGMWLPIDDLYGGALNCDVMMIPVVDVTSGTGEFNTKNYTLKPVYPSPASDFITLDYSLKNNNDQVSYIVFDKTGKIVCSKVLSNQNAGSNSSQINISELPTGNYYLSFKAGEISVTQKFMKIK